jgi:hypothetical protein
MIQDARSHEIKAFFGLNEVGIVAESGRRGWRERKSKLSSEAIREINARIETFHTVKSRYFRKITKRQYFVPHLSVNKIHDLYT